MKLKQKYNIYEKERRERQRWDKGEEKSCIDGVKKGLFQKEKERKIPEMKKTVNVYMKKENVEHKIMKKKTGNLYAERKNKI